jgi:BlaR1 peptidase M56
VRRRDFVTQNVSALNECLFWFHPLAWRLDRHLKSLAEEASDDCALNVTADRHEYADVLLGFAARAREAGGRVRWQGLAMAGRRSMSQRIERILNARSASSPRLSKMMLMSLFVLAPLIAGSMAAVQPFSKIIVRDSPIKPLPTPLKDVTIDSFLGSWQCTQGSLHVSIELKKRHGKLTGIALNRFVQNRSVRESRLQLGAVPPAPPPPPPPPPPSGRVLHPRFQGDTLRFTIEPFHGGVETHYLLRLDARETATLGIVFPGGLDVYPALKLMKTK